MGYDCKRNFIPAVVFICSLVIFPVNAENYGRPTLTDEEAKAIKEKYSRTVLFGDSQLDTNNVSKKVEVSGSGSIAIVAATAGQALPEIFSLPVGTPFTSGKGNAAQQIFGYDFTRSNPLTWGTDWTADTVLGSFTTGTLRINSVGLSEKKIDNTKNVNMAQGGAKLNKTFPGTDRALLAGLSPISVIAQSLLPSVLGDRNISLLKPIVDQPKEFSNKGGSFGPRDIAMLLAGGNDAIAQGYDGEADLQFAKNELYVGREKALGGIAKLGAKNIFFGNLPDLRLTPELINWTPGGKNSLHLGVARETDVARTRITDILLGANEQTAVSMLRVTLDNPGTTVTLFDIFKFIQHVAADRERYGILNDISISCSSVPQCNDNRASEGGKYFTEDGLHPSEKTSEIIANAYKYYLRDTSQPLMSRVSEGRLSYDPYFDAFADVVVTKEGSGLTHNVAGGVLDLSLKSQVDSLTPQVVLNGALLRFDDGAEKNQDSQYANQLSADILIKERFAGIEIANASSELIYSGNASGPAFLKSGLGTLALTGNNSFDGGGAGRFGVAVVGGGLQVGNGGDTGSLNSDVIINENSSLAFNHSIDHSFAGNVVGTGALLKKGAGVLTLTGDADHRGGTIISAGTLQVGDGSDKGSLAGDVQNEARLAFNHGVDHSFAGNVVGTGALLKKGTGVLTLTGDADHRGGTIISAGTLQVGDGSNKGSLAGDVQNEARLAFNHGVDHSFAGNVVGTGALLKKGTGVLTLTGDNAHSGGTTISAGTLQIGDGSDKGWLQGNVVNDAVMVFNRGDNQQFDGRIDGSGSIVKIGTGSVNLTGSGGVTGRTEVRRGKLGFNGIFDATDVQVSHGALVYGGGTVRSLSLEAGGAIAPGNSIGTFNVINDIVFNKGSVYAIDANAAGLSDMIKAGGVADIKGGDVLVDAESGQYSPTSQYTVLSTRGGVNGQFDSVSANFAFLDPSLSYGMSDVSLLLVRNDVKPIDLCQGANEKAVCAELLPEVEPVVAVTPVVPEVEPVVAVTPVVPAVEPVVAVTPVVPAVEPVVAVTPVVPVVEPLVALGERNDLFERENAVVIGMSKSEFTRFASLLPGDIHPTVKTVLAQESSYIRDSISKRLYETEKGWSDSGAWGYVFGSEGRQKGAKSISGLSRNTQGFILGSDVWVEDADLSLGVIGGYRKTSMSQRASSADIGTYNLGIYGSKRYEALSVRLGASFSWHDIETKRKVNYKGSVSTPDSDYRGNTAQLFSELAYDLKFDRFSVEPFVGLSYNRLEISRFSEEKDLFSLSGKRDVKDIYAGTLGARVNYSIQYNDDIKTSFQAGAGLKHTFSDVSSNTNMALHSRGNDFRISGLPLKKNIAQLNAKVSVQTKGGFSVGLDYMAENASGMRDQSLSAFGLLEF